MKSLILVPIIVFALIFTSCGKKEEVKKEDGKKEAATNNFFKDLKYASEMSTDDWTVSNFLDKSTGGSAFSVNISIIASDPTYNDEFKEKVMDKYIMKSKLDNSTGSYKVFVLINNIYQVEASGLGSATGALKEYNNLDMLKKLIVLFDLDGISKLPPENVTGKDLVKYMPKFEFISNK